MHPGAFVADDYYNHYSLQRTIEDSLGIAPLTNNDKYAQPMERILGGLSHPVVDEIGPAAARWSSPSRRAGGGC